MLKKRLDVIDSYVIPPNEFRLPTLPEGAVAAFTFSLSDGVKLRVSYFDIQMGNLGVTERFIWRTLQ